MFNPLNKEAKPLEIGPFLGERGAILSGVLKKGVSDCDSLITSYGREFPLKTTPPPFLIMDKSIQTKFVLGLAIHTERGLIQETIRMGDTPTNFIFEPLPRGVMYFDHRLVGQPNTPGNVKQLLNNYDEFLLKCAQQDAEAFANNEPIPVH